MIQEFYYCKCTAICQVFPVLNFDVSIRIGTFVPGLRMSEIDVRTGNSLLNALNVQSSEKLIAIKENGLADANFVITNLIKQIFAKEERVCLVIMHNTLGHYQNVGKKLGYDLIKMIQLGHAITVEPLKTIAETIGRFLSKDKETIVKELFLEINDKIRQLLSASDNRVHLIIDDVSHLLDLGIDVKHVIAFLDYCVNLSSENVCVIINTHVSNTVDEIISNSFVYVADLNIEVSPLKTGVSHDVTGVITIRRKEEDVKAVLKQSVYHYKAYEREIKTFAPGESLFYFGK